MGIISYSKDTVIDYVPEYGDNRKDDNPTIVGLRFISFGDARENARLQATKTRHADTPEKSMAISQALQKEKFLKSVEYVKEYKVDDKEVTDLEQFYLTAPGELISEILQAQECSHRLDKGQLKNFERASGGAS